MCCSSDLAIAWGVVVGLLVAFNACCCDVCKLKLLLELFHIYRLVKTKKKKKNIPC